MPRLGPDRDKVADLGTEMPHCRHARPATPAPCLASRRRLDDGVDKARLNPASPHRFLLPRKGVTASRRGPTERTSLLPLDLKRAGLSAFFRPASRVALHRPPQRIWDVPWGASFSRHAPVGEDLARADRQRGCLAFGSTSPSTRRALAGVVLEHGTV